MYIYIYTIFQFCFFISWHSNICWVFNAKPIFIEVNLWDCITHS